MNEQRKSISKASLVGFGLSLLSLAGVLFYNFNDYIIHNLGRDFFEAAAVAANLVIFIGIPAGFVFSIIGLKNISRKNLRGKAFSIIAIIILLIESATVVFAVVLLLMVGFRRMAIRNTIMDKRKWSDSIV